MYISVVYQKVIMKEMYNILCYLLTVVILGSIRLREVLLRILKNKLL